MNRYVKIISVALICAALGIFMLNRAVNGVAVEYSQLPQPERKVANMLDEVYVNVVANKSYRLRRGSYYVIMRFAPNRANRAGDIINLSGIIARQTRENLTDNQLRAEEIERRRAL
jgi:hypothetical protein